MISSRNTKMATPAPIRAATNRAGQVMNPAIAAARGEPLNHATRPPIALAVSMIGAANPTKASASPPIIPMAP